MCRRLPRLRSSPNPGLLNFSLHHYGYGLGSEVTWGSQLLMSVLFR